MNEKENRLGEEFMKKKEIALVVALSMLLSTWGGIGFNENYVYGETKPAAQTTEETKAAEQKIDKVAAMVPEKTEAKKLSLKDAVKIMQTEGSTAETAQLHKESDEAVSSGYSEKVQKINETEKKLDQVDAQLSKAIAGASYQLQQTGLNKYQATALATSLVGASAGNAVSIAYEAQQAGVTSNNKKIMQMRRTFAEANKENNYQAEMNSIEADTISMYYKVLLAQEQYDIAKENVAVAEKTLKNVNAKKAVGTLSKKDVLQAQSNLTEAESNKRSAETILRYAKMGFNYMLGYNTQQEIILTDTIASAASGEKITSPEEAVKKAYENRLELKGAALAVDVYDVLLKDVSDYPKKSSTYLTAKINLANAKKTEKDAYSRIEIDVRNKYNVLQDKKTAVDSAKKLLAYATEGERLMNLTYEEGMSTVDELLAVQVSRYKAKLNLANANAEYAFALKAYEYSQGLGTTRLPL